MNIADLFRLSFDALAERKVRAVLTILMVVIGATLITGLNGLTSGMNEYMLEQFSTLGANVVIVFPSMTRGGGTSFRISEQTTKLLQGISGVKDAVPFIQQIGAVESGSSSKNTYIIGVNQQKLPLIFPTISLISGQFAPPQDSVTVVLGNTLAYPPGSSTPFADYNQAVSIKYSTLEGQKTTTLKRTFRVGGVLAYMGTSGMFIPIDRMAMMSLAAANALFKKSGYYDGAFVVAINEGQVDTIVSEIRKITGGNVEVYSSKSIIEMIGNIMGSLQLIMGSIAAVSLIVASVGIFTALYTSVMERTREIGVLKALGFKKRMIVGIFINEAILIGMIGGVVGIVAGVGLAYVLAEVTGRMRMGMATAGPEAQMPGFVAPVFTLETLIFVWGFCAVLSVLAGIYPAWRAAKLDPVVALRKE